MSNIYTSADQLIGKTPLLELTHIEKQYDLKAKILAKLEYFWTILLRNMEFAKTKGVAAMRRLSKHS